MTRSRVGSKYPMRMDMAFFAPIMNAVCLKGTGHNILLGRATPTNGIFGNHRSEDTPLRRSLPRAQCYERIEYHPVDLQALAECALARAKCPLGRNADIVDAGPPWRCLDALDQLRHLALECVGWPKKVGSSARPRASATLRRRRPSVMMIASSAHRIGTHDRPPLSKAQSSEWSTSRNVTAVNFR